MGRQGEVGEIGDEGSEASGPYPLAGVVEYGAACPFRRGRADAPGRKNMGRGNSTRKR